MAECNSRFSRLAVTRRVLAASTRLEFLGALPDLSFTLVNLFRQRERPIYRRTQVVIAGHKSYCDAFLHFELCDDAFSTRLEFLGALPDLSFTLVNLFRQRERPIYRRTQVVIAGHKSYCDAFLHFELCDDAFFPVRPFDDRFMHRIGSGFTSLGATRLG